MLCSIVMVVRCGELLCQRNSYAKTMKTLVVSCSPKVVAAASAKGKKNQPAAPIQELWDAVLDDTVLFPEGGGQ